MDYLILNTPWAKGIQVFPGTSLTRVIQSTMRCDDAEIVKRVSNQEPVIFEGKQWQLSKNNRMYTLTMSNARP